MGLVRLPPRRDGFGAERPGTLSDSAKPVLTWGIIRAT